MNQSKNELLRTKAIFMCVSELIDLARQNNLTGHIRIEWNTQDARLIEWVKSKILPVKMLETTGGFLILKRGLVVGAKVGSDAPADMDQSLDFLMQMCYGIGCAVLPSTTLTLEGSEPDTLDVIRSVTNYELIEIICALEGSVGRQFV